MMRRSVVYRVDEVMATLLKSNPPQLNITAHGMVPTSGWRKPELVPYVYIMPPVDRIWDFVFIAEPPTEIVSQVLTPIVATYTMENTEVRGIRVHASSNMKEVLIGETPGEGRKVYVKGILTNEGIECQALRADSGELYTLVGDLQGFKIGDTVYVLGAIVLISVCMQGITIAVDQISKSASKCDG